MNNIYQAPDWFFQEAKLDKNLYPKIKKELLDLFQYRFNDTPLSLIHSQFVVPADIEYVKENCPAIMAQLKQYGLDDVFVMLAMIIVAPGTDYPIHVDTLNHGKMSFGLNIPVLNCHDSYTAWYDAEILYHESFAPNILNTKFDIGTGLPCSHTNAVELARCSANIPHWINVVKPHAAICTHDKLRVNSSFRFDKKIFEMLADGSFYEKCTTTI